VTLPLEREILGAALIFCRVAGCLMLLPGFGSERIPVRVRLYFALGVTVALAPALWTGLEPKIASATLAAGCVAAITETIIGGLIGLTCRLFILALETMATAIATSFGLSGALGAPIDESAPIPALATLSVVGVTTLMFVLDQHWELIRGLRQSYDILPPMEAPEPRAMLNEILRTIDRAFVMTLRISSPFMLFGLIINLAFGFLNRMVPQAPVHFVSAPLMIILGIYWFYALTPEFFASFAMDFGAWLDRG
jgi:flagellar biosynthetic protein FliR